MSRDSEKVIKAMHEYIDKYGNEDMNEEQMNSLMQQFMEEYNSNLPEPVTEKTAKTSEDYVELAESTEDIGKAGIYAKKALKLDPDNLDAERILIDCTSSGVIHVLKKYDRAIKHGNEVMKKRGYMNEDCIGDYWGIFETRPYIRLCGAYVETLVDCGMYGRALAEAKNIIHLNEGDNLGMRYKLMHIYSLLEREEEALALHAQYDNSEETMMLLPLSILFFKKGDFDTAEKYLKKLCKSNKDTKKFVKAFVNDDLERYLREISDYGYRPYSIEELIIDMTENSFLIANMSAYFFWANDILNKKKR